MRLTEPKDILMHFQKNAPNGERYYLRDSYIISNVPTLFYDEQSISIYQNPKGLSDDQKDLIQTIQRVTDYIHSLFHLKLGACFENSSIIFYNFKQIEYIKLDTKLVFGIYSHRMPHSQTQEGFVLDNDQIIIHEWHVWNYVNEILVDTTILKNQHSVTTFVSDWGNAGDHVFGYGNEGDRYMGVSFDDYEKFEQYFRNLLNV